VYRPKTVRHAAAGWLRLAFAAGALVCTTAGHAATTETVIRGSLANNVNTCFRLVTLRSGDDGRCALNNFRSGGREEWSVMP